MCEIEEKQIVDQNDSLDYQRNKKSEIKETSEERALRISQKALGVSVGSLIIAGLSLLYVFYLDFIAPARISVNYDKIITLRLNQGDRDDLVRQIAFDDIISSSPSTQAHKILDSLPELKVLIENKEYSKAAELLNKVSLSYSVDDNTIKKYIGNPKFVANFCIPLNIVNSGNKHSYISRLYLQIVSAENSSKKWLYSTFMQFDADKLGNLGNVKDKDRMKGLFNGVGLLPNEEVLIWPWFQPLVKLENKDIYKEGLRPGNYNLILLGFGPEKEEIFRSKAITIEMKTSDFVSNFKGTDISTTLKDIELEKKLI